MAEFWESSFRDKQEMWGFEPADSAIATVELFKRQGLKKILIPGFGYGRNAQVFTDNGFDVTGIEISETAIELARRHYGDNIKVHHGSVSEMPLDSELYDGIFCYALIHLLNEEDRLKLIKDCYHQLKPGGYMVFVTISKQDARYGDGKEVREDTFETKHGVTLFFYDPVSVEREFGSYGQVKTEVINEPISKPSQKFLQVVCRKV